MEPGHPPLEWECLGVYGIFPKLGVPFLGGGSL